MTLNYLKVNFPAIVVNGVQELFSYKHYSKYFLYSSEQRNLNRIFIFGCSFMYFKMCRFLKFFLFMLFLHFCQKQIIQVKNGLRVRVYAEDQRPIWRFGRPSEGRSDVKTVIANQKWPFLKALCMMCVCVRVITQNSSRGALKDFPGKSFSDKYHKPRGKSVYCDPNSKMRGIRLSAEIVRYANEGHSVQMSWC